MSIRPSKVFHLLCRYQLASDSFWCCHSVDETSVAALFRQLISVGAESRTPMDQMLMVYPEDKY